MEAIFDQITEARKTLELPEFATIKQIRENYRRLIKESEVSRFSAMARKLRVWLNF
ncbi:MAG: hypothetical protein WA081_00595 [Desulfosalsimonadaceae bacterium]